jgi:hypothetical protein
LGQCVITGLSTGYCFNGPVSKRLNLSQNLFRATIIATLQKIEKKKEKRKHCSKFGKTQNWRLLKTINQMPTEHLDWPVEPKSPITPQYFFIYITTMHLHTFIIVVDFAAMVNIWHYYLLATTAMHSTSSTPTCKRICIT